MYPGGNRMSVTLNSDYLVPSDNYAGTMNGTVLPWLQERQQEKTVSGFEGRPLYAVSYHAENPVGTVLIVHGFTENAYKYAELIWSLLHLRFSVVAYDQRGHGRSWRADGIPDASITHVDRFQEYVEDLRIICETFRSNMPEPFLVFAHSMGGAVTSLFLEQFPGVFSAAVLSSPMIAPCVGGVPFPLASMLASAAGFAGMQKHKPFFMKTYAGPEDFSTSCATDPNRFAWYDQVKASRRDFQNSVPSWRWSYESIHVTERILAPGQPEKIDCPVLLFTAGTDSSVLPGPQEAFISRIRQGKHVLVMNARHEIFRSTDDVLFPWWHETITFFRAAVPTNQIEGGSRP